MQTRRNQQRKNRVAKHRRRGVLVSAELTLALPIVVILLCAVVELSMLWSVNHLVKAASQAGCRVACLPSGHPTDSETAAYETVANVLGKQRLVDAHFVTLEPGRFTGDPVICEVRLPMGAAAPNMLAMFGFSLEGRELVARTVMRKE